VGEPTLTPYIHRGTPDDQWDISHAKPYEYEYTVDGVTKTATVLCGCQICELERADQMFSSMSDEELLKRVREECLRTDREIMEWWR